ncbi:MAG: type I restriction-modification system subunit M N-terminal domain-containing protein, partial [Ruminiclostridium sp.]|nr:type I restriction-modification system subunit M N-terminal domain-containing protein [Ruminiclostridium sp.]
MTKQELAAKIWATANELRKNIKASEYKDYILGFMFYKYLSDKEIDYLYEKGGDSVEDLIDLDKETIDMFKDH